MSPDTGEHPVRTGSRATRSILVVEDNPEDLELTKRTLTRAHISNPVEAVGDGAACMGYLLSRTGRSDASQLPVVVLLDLKLPKMDGFEVLVRMQDDKKLKAVPVIVLTSSEDQEDVLQSYSLGAFRFIRKPVELRPLREALANLGIQWLLVSPLR